MEVIYGIDRIYHSERPAGVGLGNFDGLHVGHMTLINTLISESKLLGLKSILYTFTKHPENILRKSLITPLITTEWKKIQLLKGTDLDVAYFDEFNEDFSRLSPEEFVKNLLVDRLKIKLAVVGFDYRFGYRGQGDVPLLKTLGKKYGFKVVMIHPIKVDDEVVSSTIIRKAILRGDMDSVFKLLGRHYSVTGKVQQGKQIGNKIGFPTANLYPEDYLVLPHTGIYITKTLIDGVLYSSVTNVGYNPTFERLEKTSVETHILDFDKDIYDNRIEVFFISRIRGEKKFHSKEDLIGQIAKDILVAKDFFHSYESMD